MTLLAVVINALLKPLLIALWGWCQYGAMQSFSAGIRYGQLMTTIILLPISLALSLLVTTPPITLEVTPSTWLSQDITSDLRGLLALYIFIASWGLSYLLLGVYKLKLQQQSDINDCANRRALQNTLNRLLDKLNIQQPVQLILDDECPSPYSFSRVIVLPMDAVDCDESQLHLILLHELGHIERRDWRNLLASKLVCWLLWFFPPVWLFSYHLDAMAERACDDWVLKRQGKPTQYAELLLNLSQRVSDLPANHLLNCSHYERLLALLENYQDREPSSQRETLKHLTPSILLLLVMTQVGVQVSSDDWGSASTPLNLQWPQRPGAAQAPNELRPASITAPTRPAQPLLKPQKNIEQVAVIATPTPWYAGLGGLVITHKAQLQAVEVSGYLPRQLVTPRYPARAIRRSIEGHVTVKFGLDTSGRVTSPHIEDSSPLGVFEETTLRALHESSFAPLRVNGEATAITGLTETFSFQLRDEHPPPK